MTIAGHLFNGPGDACSCGKRLSDLSWVYGAGQAAVVNQQDVAHTGICTADEYAQIMAAFDRLALTYGGRG